MKVVLARYGSGDVYILPSQSDDVVNDGIFLRQLRITEGMDERLKKLIVLTESLE